MNDIDSCQRRRLMVRWDFKLHPCVADIGLILSLTLMRQLYHHRKLVDGIGAETEIHKRKPSLELFGHSLLCDQATEYADDDIGIVLLLCLCDPDCTPGLAFRKIAYTAGVEKDNIRFIDRLRFLIPPFVAERPQLLRFPWHSSGTRMYEYDRNRYVVA